MSSLLVYSILDVAKSGQRAFVDLRELECAAYLAAQTGDPALSRTKFSVDKEGPYSLALSDVVRDLLVWGLLKDEPERKCLELSESGAEWFSENQREPSAGVREAVQQATFYAAQACKLAALTIYHMHSEPAKNCQTELRRALDQRPELSAFQDQARELVGKIQELMGVGEAGTSEGFARHEQGKPPRGRLAAPTPLPHEKRK